MRVRATPCHTVGHVAFHVTPVAAQLDGGVDGAAAASVGSSAPGGTTSSLHLTGLDIDESGWARANGRGALFVGDTMFVGGCGRFFEGTAVDMVANMRDLCALPDETLVYCGHE